MLRKTPDEIIGTRPIQDIVVTPDLNNIPRPPTIVDASGSELGYTLKPIPADNEDLRRLDAPAKRKVGRPLKLPSGLSSALSKARPVGRPPGPLVVATDEVQFVARLPRVAQPPLRAAKTAPLPLSTPILGPNMGHVSVTKKRDPAVFDANKARFLARNGLSLTSPTNKQNTPVHVNKQVLGNKQPNSMRPPSNPQETSRRRQQRPSPYPQQRLQQQQTRGTPHQIPAAGCTSGTPEDILRALSSSPAVQQSPSYRGNHMKLPSGRMPPPNRSMPSQSRGMPPHARGMPPYSRGMPSQARGTRAPPGGTMGRDQKIMPTGLGRRILAPKPGFNQPRARINQTARPSTNEPQGWANQKQSAVSNTLRALNQDRGMSVSNLTRPLPRQPSGFPIGAKLNVPLGVTIAAPKS